MGDMVNIHDEIVEKVKKEDVLTREDFLACAAAFWDQKKEEHPEEFTGFLISIDSETFLHNEIVNFPIRQLVRKLIACM